MSRAPIAELEAATIAAIKRDASRDRRHLFDDLHAQGLAAARPRGRAHGSAQLLRRGREVRPAVLPGEAAGAFAATHFLVQRDIAASASSMASRGWTPSADRLKGYRQALGERRHRLRSGDRAATATGCPLQGHRHARELHRARAAADRDLLRQRPHGDGRAGGGGAGVGLRVPEDISIMGYDDHELARYTHPPLSTLVLPNYEMGRRAVGLAPRHRPRRPRVARRRSRSKARWSSAPPSPPRRPRRSGRARGPVRSPPLL